MHKLSQNKANEFSTAFNVADLVSCLHLQFVSLLEKQTSKKIFIFINLGKYYLPLWKNETTLLKLHPQLTYKQNEKQYYIVTHFVVLLSCVVVFNTAGLKSWLAKFINRI